jgi:hypothetical protein
MRVSTLVQIVREHVPAPFDEMALDILGKYKVKSVLPSMSLETDLYLLVVQSMEHMEKPFNRETLSWLLEVFEEREDELPHKLVVSCHGVLETLAKKAIADEMVRGLFGAMASAARTAPGADCDSCDEDCLSAGARPAPSSKDMN